MSHVDHLISSLRLLIPVLLQSMVHTSYSMLIIWYVYMCICMCVCMYVCVYVCVCMYVCVCVYVCMCMYVFMYVCIGPGMGDIYRYTNISRVNNV